MVMMRGQLTPDLRWLRECVGGDIAHLRGYWTSQRGGVAPGGTWLDLSGRGNDATVVDPSYVDNNGLQCNELGEGYANCGNDASLQITGPITLVAWLKTPSMLDDDDAILSKWNNAAGSRGVVLYYDFSDGAFKFAKRQSGDGGTDIIIGGTTPTVDTIYHVAATWDGANINLYVNGVVDATPVATSAATLNSNAAVLLGAQYNFGVPDKLLNSWLDEAMIFATGLPAAKIQAIYDATKWRFQ
jgi:hypothetical protein